MATTCIRKEVVHDKKKYRATFVDQGGGEGRCVMLKQWVNAGLGHWRLCEMTGPAGRAAIKAAWANGEAF